MPGKESFAIRSKWREAQQLASGRSQTLHALTMQLNRVIPRCLTSWEIETGFSVRVNQHYPRFQLWVEAMFNAKGAVLTYGSEEFLRYGFENIEDIRAKFAELEVAWEEQIRIIVCTDMMPERVIIIFIPKL